MVYFEKNIDKTHKKKNGKVQRFLRANIKNDCIIDILLIEIRCQGFIAYLTSAYLTKLNFLLAKKKKKWKYIKRLQD